MYKIPSTNATRTYDWYMNNNDNTNLPESCFKILRDTNVMRRAMSSKFLFTDLPQIRVQYPNSVSNFNPLSPAGSEFINIDPGSWVGNTNMHEYGHYVDWRCRSRSFPSDSGQAHGFNQQVAPGTAIVEGFGTFLMCVTENRKSYEFDNGAVEDLAPTSNTKLYGIKNESAVCGQMIDVWDQSFAATNERYIFDLIRQYKPSSYKGVYDGWVSNGWSFQTQLKTNMQSHGMNPPTFNPY